MYRNLDSVAYVSILRDILDLFIKESYLTDLFLQQGGAAAHTSKFTSYYFVEKEIVELVWFAQLQDMNTKKNIWEKLALGAYKEGNKFDTLDDLCEYLQFE